MVEDFYKNGRILDRGNAAMIAGAEPPESKFLFGSDALIERMNMPDMKDEQRARAANMPVSDWWMGASNTQQTPSKSASPLTVPYHNSPEVGFDGEHGPPGVPLFLAQARNVSLGINDIYDAETAAGMQPPEVLAMMPNNYPMMQPEVLSGNNGLPMLRIDDGIPAQALFRPDGAPAPPQPYIPAPPPPPPRPPQPQQRQQQGIMMNGYAPPPPPPQYTQQPNYS